MAKRGVTWTNGGPTAASAKLAARGAGGTKIVAEILQENMNLGMEIMAQFIEQRGTDSEWKQKRIAAGGHPGRYDEGYMLGDVGTGDAPVIEGSKVTAMFGWGAAQGGRGEEYYLYQEKGFTQPSGHHVPPMHALLDAFVYIREKIRRELAQASFARKA